MILELRGQDAQSSEAFTETILPYCLESLGRWPDDLYREVPDSWAELWRKGQGAELVDLCRSKLGSYYLCTRCAGSGSVTMSSCFWTFDKVALREEVDAYANLFENEPGDVDVDVDILWQRGHRLITFWEGVEVHDVDINAHWVFTKWYELSGVRSAQAGHQTWRGQDARGQDVEVSFDELLEAVFDAKPGDLIARVAWDEVELPELRGRARQQPIELDEDVAIRMERSVRFSLFDEYEGSWPAMEKKSYFG